MVKKGNILEALSQGLITSGRGLQSAKLANKLLGISQSATSSNNELITKELQGGNWVISGVTSTNVDTIAYDSNSLKLYVRFKNGSKYVYSGVSPQIAIMFKTAPSKGKFVWSVLRGNLKKGGTYCYQKIGSFPKWIGESGLVDQNPNRFFKQLK